MMVIFKTVMAAPVLASWSAMLIVHQTARYMVCVLVQHVCVHPAGLVPRVMCRLVLKYWIAVAVASVCSPTRAHVSLDGPAMHVDRHTVASLISAHRARQHLGVVGVMV